MSNEPTHTNGLPQRRQTVRPPVTGDEPETQLLEHACHHLRLRRLDDAMVTELDAEPRTDR
jgi:hypothetical protein